MRVKELRPQEPGDQKVIVGVIRENDRCPVEEFLSDFAIEKPKDFATLVRRMDLIKVHGDPRNKEVLKKVQGYEGVLEIRHHDKQFRVTCFQVGRRLVCVDGFFKKATKDRRAKAYYRTAETTRTEYLRERKKNGEPQLDR